MNQFEKIDLCSQLDRGYLIYRNPNKQKHNGDDLVAKNPDANYQIFEHLMNGSNENIKSQFYSASTSFECALKNKTGNEDVLFIDVKKIIDDNLDCVELIDVSSYEKAEKLIIQESGLSSDNGYVIQACNHANASSEILIKGKIPSEYYKTIPWKIFDFFRNRVKDEYYKEVVLDFIELNPEKNGNDFLELLEEEISKDRELECFIDKYIEVTKLLNNNQPGASIPGSNLAYRLKSVNKDFQIRFKGLDWNKDMMKVFSLENEKWTKAFREYFKKDIDSLKTYGLVFNEHKEWIIKRLKGKDEFLELLNIKRGKATPGDGNDSPGNR